MEWQPQTRHKHLQIAKATDTRQVVAIHIAKLVAKAKAKVKAQVKAQKDQKAQVVVEVTLKIMQVVKVAQNQKAKAQQKHS